MGSAHGGNEGEAAQEALDFAQGDLTGEDEEFELDGELGEEK